MFSWTLAKWVSASECINSEWLFLKFARNYFKYLMPIVFGTSIDSLFQQQLEKIWLLFKTIFLKKDY